jgi:hypothetical protein
VLLSPVSQPVVCPPVRKLSSPSHGLATDVVSVTSDSSARQAGEGTPGHRASVRHEYQEAR